MSKKFLISTKSKDEILDVLYIELIVAYVYTQTQQFIAYIMGCGQEHMGYLAC